MELIFQTKQLMNRTLVLEPSSNMPLTYRHKEPWQVFPNKRPMPLKLPSTELSQKITPSKSSNLESQFQDTVAATAESKLIMCSV